MALSAANQRLEARMRAVCQLIEEMRAELARMPKGLHGHAVYLDRVEALQGYERHLKWLDGLKEVQSPEASN